MNGRDDNHQLVRRAEEARQVLANPAYIDAMLQLHLQIVAQWQDCPIRDREGQMLLLQLKKLAVKFEGTLASMVEAGKLAASKIDLDDERNESGARRVLRKIL